jgi:hypothetical protein
MVEYFNSTGWIAIFSGTEELVGRTRHVDGWSDSGEAMVVDPSSGTMRPVSSWPDFSHLEQAYKIVGVVAGGDWRAKWLNEGSDGTPLVEPIIAWAVTSHGNVIPLEASKDGTVESASLADELLPPADD